jgi:hypothetical protein
MCVLLLGTWESLSADFEMTAFVILYQLILVWTASGSPDQLIHVWFAVGSPGQLIHVQTVAGNLNE